MKVIGIGGMQLRDFPRGFFERQGCFVKVLEFKGIIVLIFYWHRRTSKFSRGTSFVPIA